jgi:hypothetical protein
MCDPQAVVTHDRGSIETSRTVLRRLVTYGRSGQSQLHIHPRRGAAQTQPDQRPGRRRRAGWPGSHDRAGNHRPSLALVVAVLAVDTRIRLGRDRPAGRALGESLACAVMDWAFDLGEFVGAWQLGRPDRLFTGFAWTDDPAFVW